MTRSSRVERKETSKQFYWRAFYPRHSRPKRSAMPVHDYLDLSFAMVFARGVSSIRPRTQWILGNDGLLLATVEAATGRSLGVLRQQFPRVRGARQYYHAPETNLR